MTKQEKKHAAALAALLLLWWFSRPQPQEFVDATIRSEGEA